VPRSGLGNQASKYGHCTRKVVPGKAAWKTREVPGISHRGQAGPCEESSLGGTSICASLCTHWLYARSKRKKLPRQPTARDRVCTRPPRSSSIVLVLSCCCLCWGNSPRQYCSLAASQNRCVILAFPSKERGPSLPILAAARCVSG